MSALVLDTLEHANKLKEAGFTEKQAEEQVRFLVNFARAQGEHLATKRDLGDLGQEFRRELMEIEYKLTIRFGSMIALAVGILAALIKL